MGLGLVCVPCLSAGEAEEEEAGFLKALVRAPVASPAFLRGAWVGRRARSNARAGGDRDGSED